MSAVNSFNMGPSGVRAGECCDIADEPRLKNAM